MGIAAWRFSLHGVSNSTAVSSHLQIQFHPFREKKNNAIKIRVFLVQLNPQALQLLDPRLSDRAVPLPGLSLPAIFIGLQGRVSSGRVVI
jgi:hypothetical protein